MSWASISLSKVIPPPFRQGLLHQMFLHLHRKSQQPLLKENRSNDRIARGRIEQIRKIYKEINKVHPSDLRRRLQRILAHGGPAIEPGTSNGLLQHRTETVSHHLALLPHTLIYSFYGGINYYKRINHLRFGGERRGLLSLLSLRLSLEGSGAKLLLKELFFLSWGDLSPSGLTWGSSSSSPFLQ